MTRFCNREVSRGVSKAEVKKLQMPVYMAGKFERESLERWRDELRAADAPDALVFERLTMILHPVLEYLGSACTPVMSAVHVWCLLYAVRPDLIEYESMQSAARRFGVQWQIVRRALQEVEANVPGFRFRRLECDNVNHSKRLTSRTLEGRRAIQRRIALKRAGAQLDQFDSSAREEFAAALPAA